MWKDVIQRANVLAAYLTAKVFLFYSLNVYSNVIRPVKEIKRRYKPPKYNGRTKPESMN